MKTFEEKKTLCVQFCMNLNQISIAKVVTTNSGSDQIDEKAM